MDEVRFENATFPDEMYSEKAERNISQYTELRYDSSSHRTYDHLNKKEPVVFLNGKVSISKIPNYLWLKFILILFITCVLSCGLTYLISNIVQNANDFSACYKGDCSIGQCCVDIDGAAICFGQEQNATTESTIKVSTEHMSDVVIKPVCDAIRDPEPQIGGPDLWTRCPAEWISYKSWCYKEYLDEKTWLRARDSCRILGADLVSIHSQEEQSFLMHHFSLALNDYWNGLNDRQLEGQFSWSDESNVDFFEFGPTEPNNLNRNEDCVHFNDGHNGKWNDINCYMSYPYICKMDRQKNCGKGWLYYNNSCYMLNPTIGRKSPADWSQARQYCSEIEADLAIIQTICEFNFLLIQAMKSQSNYLWIGLYQISGKYRWIDQTSPILTFWSPGQPEDSYIPQCVAVNSKNGLWTQMSCSTSNGYICEKSV